MNPASTHHNHRTLESMSQAIWYNRWTLSKFSPYLYGDILEVGCGIGNFTETLTRYGSVRAFDKDRVCVTRTKALVGKKAAVAYGDIERGIVPFREKKYDSIVCLNVLEHIKDDGAAISHMVRFLKPNGTLIILVPVFDFLFGSIDESIHHFRRYDKKRLIAVLERHTLQVLFARKLNFFGAIGWWFAGRVLKTASVRKRQLLLFNRFAPFLLPFEDLIEPPVATSVLVIARRTETH